MTLSQKIDNLIDLVLLYPLDALEHLPGGDSSDLPRWRRYPLKHIAKFWHLIHQVCHQHANLIPLGSVDDGVGVLDDAFQWINDDSL